MQFYNPKNIVLGWVFVCVRVLSVELQGGVKLQYGNNNGSVDYDLSTVDHCQATEQ